MSLLQGTETFFAEIFTIDQSSLPELYAYNLLIRGSGEQNRLGRKLADRLTRKFGGQWVWTDEVIVTTQLPDNVQLEQAIQAIRIAEKDSFKDLVKIENNPNWQPTATSQAEFCAQGLFPEFHKEMQDLLEPHIPLGATASVEREYSVRGWVVKGVPTVSISIESRVIFKDDLKTYFRKLQSPNELLGLYVADKIPYDTGKPLKGEIVDVEGQLDIDVSRNELLDIATRDASKPIIQNAERGEYVVRVGHGEYRYVLSALRIIVSPKYYKRFGIDTKKAQNATWISPHDRTMLIKKIADVARSHGLIGDALTSQQEKLFTKPKHFRYDPRITLGSKTGQPGTVEYQGDNALFNNINRHGLYLPIPNLGSLDTPLVIGVINASQVLLEPALEALDQRLKQLGFVRTTMKEEKIQSASRIDFERAISRLRSFNPHIYLGIISDSDSFDEEDWDSYYEFKSLMMSQNLPSQVIDQDTLKNTSSLSYIMQNVAFGISSKLGNIPYVLANPLDYADMIVGIDIARKRNRSGSGTQNAAAIAQIYHRGGQFTRCRVIETPLEGETVPASVLRSLFPLDEFEGKRVVVHRDGLFRGDEAKIIQNHLSQLGGEAFLVEVIKSGSPRLYMLSQNQIDSPHLGMAFQLSETEAFMVTSKSSRGTPQPLHVRTQLPFTIGKALHSVLMLTLMHYGSVKRPKLPITIHYSDKIGYLALRGVKPIGGQSTDMYWL